MTLTWKELRVSLVLMNIRDESSHVNLHCFVFLLAKRQVTVLPPSTIISIFRWKWSQKIKSWQKCRSLNICFSHHPKPYKVCIKLYFQNQYKCSIYLAGSMLTWSGDPTRSSPYAAGYQVWFGTSEASSLEMKCINWKWWLSLRPSNPSLIQNQTRKTFPTVFVETNISVRSFGFIWLAVYNRKYVIKKLPNQLLASTHSDLSPSRCAEAMA